MRLNVKQWEEIRNFARVMRENKLGAIDMTIEATSLAELRAANARLQADRARLQAWHDAVVAARVVDAVDIGTAAMVLRQANGRILELQDAVDEIERRSVKAIIRPQPLAKE